MRNYLILAVFLFISFEYCSCQTRTEVETVYNTVFTNYSKYFRPIWNQSNPLTVNISFYLIAINSFDEVEGVISLPGMFGLIWVDERLSWNPASYGNVQFLTVPQSQIWLPYIYLTSPSKGYNHIGDDEYMVKIFPNGMIVWMTGGVLKSTCTPDTTYFPFDTQNCTLTVVVFGYSPDEVRLSTLANVDLQFYVTSAEWELVTSVGYDELTFGTLPMSFAKFDVIIKRRPAYFVISILLPIIFLVLLNPLVYFLPVDSGERMSFCLTILLSFAVFMTLVDNILPKSSEPSIAFVSYYLLGTIVLSAFSTIVTVFILAAYHKPDEEKVPAFIQCLVRACCCKKNGNAVSPDASEDTNANVRKINVKTVDDKSDIPKENVITWRMVAIWCDWVLIWSLYSITIVTTILFLILLLVGSK